MIIAILVIIILCIYCSYKYSERPQFIQHNDFIFYAYNGQRGHLTIGIDIPKGKYLDYNEINKYIINVVDKKKE